MVKKELRNLYILWVRQFDCHGGSQMGRLGILLAFAIVGYFLGVALYYLFKNLYPWLIEMLPMLAQADWLIAGFIGAIVVVIVVIIWSYTSRS